MIRLNAISINELAEKLDILCDEPDLMESYGITDVDADLLYSKVCRARSNGTKLKAAPFDADALEVKVIYGELDNSGDAAYANWESGGDRSEKNFYDHMAKACKTVAEYAEYHGYDVE